MNRAIVRSIAILLLFSISKVVCSASLLPNSELSNLLQKLSANTTLEQYNQIVGAINASPALMTQLNDLASAGKLTEIRVALPDAIPITRGVRFGALVDGTQFVLSASLLKELLNNRPYDVVKANDILPNNSVFVLSHLAFHAKSSDQLARFDAEIKRRIEERSKAAGIHDYTDILALGQNTRIENEASAFIQGWNHVIDAATRSSGNQALSVDQVSTLLMNLRYRFAFAKALRLPENSMQITNAGIIEMNERNIKAIATALSTSQMADIQ